MVDNFTYKDENDNIAESEPVRDNLQSDGTGANNPLYANIPDPMPARKPVAAVPNIPIQLNRYLEKRVQREPVTKKADFAGNSYLKNQVGKFVKVCMQAGSKTLEHYGHLKAADSNYLVLSAANAEMLCEINAIKFIQII